MAKYEYTVQGVDYEVEILEVEGTLAKVTVNGIDFDVEMNNQELMYLYNEMKVNYHCKKFTRKYGFEDYIGGPTHSVDFSRIEHLALNPNARD